MTTGNPKLHLGDSWVVEEREECKEGDTDGSTSAEEQSLPPITPLRRSPRHTPPELVMPSLVIGPMNGSWANSARTTSTRQRGARFQERTTEPQRRGTRPGMNKGTFETKTKANTSLDSKGRQSYSHRESNSQASNIQDVVGVAVEHFTSMMSWLLDVLAGALQVIKRPLSYFLAIWLLFGFLMIARNLVTRSIYASLSPLCRIPGVSLLDLPFCPVYQVDNKNGPPPPVEFQELMTVQAKFEEVLEESAGGVSLPLDMKRGEASIRDLRQLVKYSHLHSKNELVLEFDGFIETARIASYDLQRFNSHVGRAVDSVIATTRWTTRVLDGIQEREASVGSINAFINNRLLGPFQPVKFTESLLLDQYIKHTRLVEEEIYKLISEAQAILMVLTNLEDRLDVIHGIATRDNVHVAALKEEVLSELWTMVGGNRGKLNKMTRQLDLLKQVGIYRKTAYAHVSGTIIRLQAMGASLEDLRERVGSPELLRDRLDVPLSVHIENIQKGVERLEESRQNSRKLEGQHIQRTLERSRSDDNLIDG